MLVPLWQLYRQTVRPGKEALLPRLVLSLLGKTTVFPRQVPLLLPGKLAPLWQLLSFQWKEVVPPRLLLSFHQWKAAAHLIPLALPKQVKSTILPVLLGKAIGTPQAQVHPGLPGGQYHLPGRQHSLHPIARPPQVSSNEEPNPKWVINLSNKPLTPAQSSVLAKGPNFAVTPRQPPNLEYITAIEAAYTKLSQQDAEELRADINRVLRSSPPPQTQLNQSTNLSYKGT